jgi:hypothetical protein
MMSSAIYTGLVRPRVELKHHLHGPGLALGVGKIHWQLSELPTAKENDDANGFTGAKTASAAIPHSRDMMRVVRCLDQIHSAHGGSPERNAIAAQRSQD